MSLRAITADLLREVHDRNQQRLDLDRQSRTLAQANEAPLQQIRDALEAEGRSEVRRGDLVARLEDGRATVSWKNEFVAVAGEEEANRLVREAPIPKRVVVSAA